MTIPIYNVVAAQRLGMGARPDELDRIGSDQVGWALSQFGSNDPGPETQSGRDRVNFFISGRKSADQAKKDGDTSAEKDFNSQLRDYYVADVSSRALYSATTATPFRERLVWFWSNHFTVSTSRPFTHALAVPFENEAIRPYINGKFQDMVLAVARHPAMLLYLDNAESIGPDSLIGQRRDKGLNENFAREVMELHTLGVDGGYSQADVTNLARILTGWMVESDKTEQIIQKFGGQADGHGFVYVDAAHEPGTKPLLDRDFGGGGVREGEAALAYISTRQATARHIARKLAVHFVSDDPPQAVVDRWAQIFYGSDGDLALVNADIARTPEVWQNAGTKIKPPEDYITAVLRALGVNADLFATRPNFPHMIVNSYNQLGQGAFAAPSPAGWSDQSRDWTSGSAVKARIDWTLALGEKLGHFYQPIDVADWALGPALSPSSRAMIAGAPSKGEGLALVFLSPEFMRR